MKKTLLLSLLSILMMGSLSAQKLRRGDFVALIGQKEINLEYDYSKMGVGKYAKEKDYVARKVKDYNKKEQGKGDLWKEAWLADRTNRFQPKFEELFLAHTKKLGTDIGDYKNAKYTMIFKTTFTEPGFNVGVVRKSARIDAEVLIVETNNRAKIVAHIILSNMPGRGGMGYDFDSGFRIQEAYAVSGKRLAKLVMKKLKKKV